MPDREKVIKGLECCSNTQCESCPYSISECCLIDDLMRDAITLLKEQQHQIWEMQDRTEYLEDKLKSQPQIVRCEECKKATAKVNDICFCHVSDLGHEQNWFCADEEERE